MRFLYIRTYRQFIERSLAGCTPDRWTVDYLWEVKTGGFSGLLCIFLKLRICLYIIWLLKNTVSGPQTSPCHSSFVISYESKPEEQLNMCSFELFNCIIFLG